MAISVVGTYSGTHLATTAQTVAFSLLRNAANVAPTLQQYDIVEVTVVNGATVNRGAGALVPAGYTACHTALWSDDNNDTNLQVSRKEMGSTPDTSVAIPASSATTNGVAYEIRVLRGVDTSNPLDVTPVTTTGISNGQPNAGSITPITPGAAITIHGGSGCGTGAVFIAPAGLSTATNDYRSSTVATTVDATVGVGIKLDWVSGAFDAAAFTGGTTAAQDSWCAVAIAWRPADITPPTITSTNTASVAENATLAKTLTANETVNWSIVGGADAAHFELSGNVLRWVSNGTKDYETPQDADTNNTYVVTVRATDLAAPAGNFTDQTITVTVTDVDDTAPTITSSAAITVNENATLSHTLTADEAVTWTKTGGADTAQFTLTGNVLSWAGATTRDYETPADSNLDNVYNVQVTATDTAGNPTVQNMTVTVQNIASPTITTSPTQSVAENNTLSVALTVSSGSPSWSIIGGADAAQFEISGSTLRWVGNGNKNYELPDDADFNNVYLVTVQAVVSGELATLGIAVTVTDLSDTNEMSKIYVIG